MTPKTRTVLDVIDAALARGDLSAAELWDVLTALRGPDRNTENLKERTTGPIRRAAFPRLTRKGVNVSTWRSSKVPGCLDDQTPYQQPLEGSAHFLGHSLNAAQVLGLII